MQKKEVDETRFNMKEKDFLMIVLFDGFNIKKMESIFPFPFHTAALERYFNLFFVF